MVTALLENIDHFSGTEQKGPAVLQRKHYAVKPNLYIDLTSFIRHFPLVVPISAFCSRPVLVFLGFYLPHLV